MDTSKVLLYSLTALVFRIAFGFISKACNMGKGYKGGFAFGFFLCVHGVIAVALRPSAREQMDYINRLTGTRQSTLGFASIVTL